MKKILLASAMSLAIVGNAQAYYDADGIYWPYEVTSAEYQQLHQLRQQIKILETRIDKIHADATAREWQKEMEEDVKHKAEAARERVRISQCSVPMLRIGCPQK